VRVRARRQQLRECVQSKAGKTLSPSLSLTLSGFVSSIPLSLSFPFTYTLVCFLNLKNSRRILVFLCLNQQFSTFLFCFSLVFLYFSFLFFFFGFLSLFGHGRKNNKNRKWRRRRRRLNLSESENYLDSYLAVSDAA